MKTALTEAAPVEISDKGSCVGRGDDNIEQQGIVTPHRSLPPLNEIDIAAKNAFESLLQIATQREANARLEVDIAATGVKGFVCRRTEDIEARDV